MKTHPNLKNLLLSVTAAVLALSLAILFSLDLPLRRELQPVEFPTDGGSLSAGYLEGERGQAVLMVLGEELSSSALLPVERLFEEGGYSVLCYQPGEGPSLEDALKTLSKWSGTPGEEILILTAGTASRPVLEELPSVEKPAGLLLLAPADGEAVPLGETPVLVLAPSSDEEATEHATKLYNRLSGDDIQVTGFPVQTSRGPVSLRVISTAVNAFLYHQGELHQEIARWTGSRFGAVLQPAGGQFAIRMVCWIAAGLAAMVMLILLYWCGTRRLIDLTYSVISISIVNKPLFTTVKLLLWLAALPLLLVFLLAAWALPLPEISGLSLIFGGYLFSYGLLMGLLYHFGKMPGIRGRLREMPAVTSPRRLAAGAAAALGLLGVLGFLGTTGLYSIHLTLGNGLWFLLFWAMLSFFLYVFSYEAILLDQMCAAWNTKLLLQTIPYTPLLLLAVLALPASSFTEGLIVILYLVLLVLCALLVRTMQLFTGRPILSAVCSGGIFAAFIVFTSL